MEQELKNLMTRIDERTQNIWRSVEKLEKHQAEQNGFILQNMKSIAKNTTWVYVLKWILGASIAGIISWLAHLEGLF